MHACTLGWHSGLLFVCTVLRNLSAYASQWAYAIALPRYMRLCNRYIVTVFGLQGTKVSVTGLQNELQQLHINFTDRHRYLLKVLTAKTLKISGQSELHYLVMQINFNDFYAKSDNMY